MEAIWYVFTIPLSAYFMWQSLSRSAWIGLAVVALLLGLLSQWHTLPAGSARRRRVMLLTGSALIVVVATPLLLIWLNASRGLVRPAGSATENAWVHIASGAILDTAERPLFWMFAMAKVRDRPWTGYGMSLTPSLYTELRRGPEHGHNLELEAALYAGIPAALLIVLFAAISLKAAAHAVLARRPLALSVAALLFFYFLLAQVEPLIFGSPYPSLLIVLILAVHLFILGGALAHQLGARFVPVRKRGKLPHDTLGHDYELEYGTDRVEIHVDAVLPGERVLLVDDLIATGGTAEAAPTLLRRAGAVVAEACFVIDLPDLGGAKRIEAMGVPVFSLVAFPGH